MQSGVDNTLRSLTLFVSSHFMFNVLGKLQSEILSGEKRKPVETLSEYSKLVRSACSFAQRDQISLKEEWDFLSLYLKLEQERFGEHTIQYSMPVVSDDSGTIPAFIVQPFAELAVLGSLGDFTASIIIEQDEKTIKIQSPWRNPESQVKLAEKLETARQRIGLFGKNYTMDLQDSTLIQIISF